MKKRILKRGETSERSDDNEDVFKRRIEVYRDETEPILEVYKE